MKRTIALILYLNYFFISVSYSLTEFNKKICNAHSIPAEKNKCISELTIIEEAELHKKMVADEEIYFKKMPIKIQIFRKLDLTFDLTKSDFNMFTGVFGIANKSQYRVKDIEITCEGYGNSGTKIDDSKKIIYEKFEANTLTTVNLELGFMRTQTTKYYCSITDFTVDINSNI